MDADGRAVVVRMHFHAGEGRVALVTKRLAGIGADLDGPAGIKHHRQRKKSDREVGAFAAIEEAEGRAIELFTTSRSGLGLGVFVERIAAAVERVASEARDDGLLNDGSRQEPPGTCGI